MKRIFAFFLAVSIEFSFGDSPIQELLKDCRAISDSAEVWWLSPQDIEWKNFKFKKLDRIRSKGLIVELQNAKFDEKGAAYFMLDMGKKALNGPPGTFGFFVIKSPERTISFRRPTAIVNPKGLQAVSLTSFDPVTKKFSWKSRVQEFGYGGIILSVSVPELMKTSEQPSK